MRLLGLIILAVVLFNGNRNVHANDQNPLIFSTNDCKLNEPLYGHQFDFRKLRSDFAHIAFSSSGDVFKFNLCGNLSRSCRGLNDVAACLRRQNGDEFILGAQHELNYRNGKMYFHFKNGDICPTSKTNETYQLFVFLSCDYTLDQKMSTVTSYSSTACAFYINFETPAACLPESENNIVTQDINQCAVRDPHTDHVYDLKSLSDTNYRTSDRQGNAFVMNICKPVLYGENAMCPPGSSICFINLKSTDYRHRFYDYGRSNGQLVIDNGQLMLRHTSLTPCNGSVNYTSTIYFYCDRDAKNAHPELMGFHGCLYEFTFATPLACNRMAPCTAVTHDNEILDLSSLKETSFTLQQDKKYYKISVCNRPGEPCFEADGACLMVDGQSTSLGEANDHLRINQTGMPYLLYENGANCRTSTNVTTKWSTKIEFICANNTSINGKHDDVHDAHDDDDDFGSSNGNDNSRSNGFMKNNESKVNGRIAALGPKVIENTNCHLLIHYQTDMACQEKISCKAKVYVDHSNDGTGMEVIDLTPLINTIDNYEADINSNILNQRNNITSFTKFFLNVCRPLVPKYGLGCPGGSAACMANMDNKTGKAEDEQSLGFPKVSLVALNRTTAELRYFMGAICPTDHKERLTSGILFNCHRQAGRGKPKLMEINDCHYQFVWATNVICPPHLCVFNKDTCEIFNEEIDVTYSLKNASFAQDGKIFVNTKEKVNFTLDLCDSHHKAVTDYSQSLVNLFFTSTGPCNGIQNDAINVQMRLICHSADESTITFNKLCRRMHPPLKIFLLLSFAGFCGAITARKPTLPEYTAYMCNLLYIQRTPDICKFLGLPEPPTTETKTVPSSNTTNEKETKEGPMAPKNLKPISTDTKITKASKGGILTVVLSIMFLTACFSFIIFSPQRRENLRLLLRHATSYSRYVRVNDDEANLLLDHNHNGFIDSDDDDMIL